MDVDHKISIVHSVEVTSANKYNVFMVVELFTRDKLVIYEDSSYFRAEKCAETVPRNKSASAFITKLIVVHSGASATPIDLEHSSGTESLRHLPSEPK